MPSRLVQLYSYFRIAALLAAVVILASWAYPPGRSHILHQTSYTDTIRVAVSGGWNLISIPLAVPDWRKNVLFPNAISDAYGYERGYVQQETLQFGKGYWLKFATPETIAIAGTWDGAETVTVNPGWNMIGT